MKRRRDRIDDILFAIVHVARSGRRSQLVEPRLRVSASFSPCLLEKVARVAALHDSLSVQ